MDTTFFKDKVFRFRSADRLLHGNEKISPELESQSIFFCPPSLLNDPIDGEIEVFFQGDEIAWKGIFENYFCCLFTSICSFRFSNDYALVSKIIPQNHFGNKPYEKHAEEKCRELFSSTHWENIKKILCDKKLPIWKAKMFFSLFHTIILDMVVCVLKEIDTELYGFFRKIVNHEIISAVTNGIANYIKALEANQSYIPEEILRVLFNGLNSLKQMRCVTLDTNEGNLPFIIQLFPDEYFNRLKESVFFKWGIASFSTDFSNPLVWSHYGDSHKGACLIFDDFTKRDVNSDLFSNIGEIAGQTAIGYGRIEFLPVNYSNADNEINFFEALGTWPQGQVKKLLNFDGESSGIYSKFVGDELEIWNKNYIQKYKKTLLHKTTSWEYEKEARLILGGLHDRFGADGYTLNYQFNRLIGIIFGVKMTATDKDKIFKTILSKCSENKRNISSFRFFQAHYNKKDNIIDAMPLVCPYLLEDA